VYYNSFINRLFKTISLDKLQAEKDTKMTKILKVPSKLLECSYPFHWPIVPYYLKLGSAHPGHNRHIVIDIRNQHLTFLVPNGEWIDYRGTIDLRLRKELR